MYLYKYIYIYIYIYILYVVYLGNCNFYVVTCKCLTWKKEITVKRFSKAIYYIKVSRMAFKLEFRPKTKNSNRQFVSKCFNSVCNFFKLDCVCIYLTNSFEVLLFYMCIKQSTGRYLQTFWVRFQHIMNTNL